MTRSQTTLMLKMPLYRRLISSNWYMYQLTRNRYCGSNPRCKRAILQVFLVIVVIFVRNGVIDQLQDYQVDIRHGVMVSGAVPVAIAYVSQVSEAESKVSAQDTGIEERICKVFGEDCEIMIAIAKAESGLRADASNTNRNGSTDTGLFQINSIHGYSVEDMKNVDKNIEAAKKIYDKQGLQAWVVYNTGAYKRYLTTAK